MTLLIELIQTALGHREMLSYNPTGEEWNQLFYECQKQAIIGMGFETLDWLAKKGQKVPANLLFKWIGANEQIKRQNLLVNQRCVEISNLFNEAGYRTCILKGQGNAQMYPIPLSRQSGDIDIWVDGEKDDIIRYVKEKFPQVNTSVSAHHVDYPIFDDVEVEVHYAPTYSITYKYKQAIEQYIDEVRDKQFKNVTIQR